MDGRVCCLVGGDVAFQRTFDDVVQRGSVRDGIYCRALMQFRRDPDVKATLVRLLRRFAFCLTKRKVIIDCGVEVGYKFLHVADLI